MVTESEAREELEQLIQWESDPALDALEVDMLLRKSRTIDAAGVKPDEVGWAGTWDIRLAASRGWRLKAAKAASDFDMKTDVTDLTRSQVIDNCLRMARVYGSATVG